MKSKKTTVKNVHVVRLERGEEIHSSLKKFCEQNKIKGGLIQGIGALSYAKVYSVTDSVRFTTTEQEFEEPMELISVSGNASTIDGKYLIHLHVTLGRKDKSTIAGHLLEGKISFTGEFFIIETNEIKRVSEDGMNQWKP